MAIADFSRVEGGAELAAVLRELPDQLAKNALAAAGRAGAAELQIAAFAQLSLYLSRRSAREDDVIIKKERTPKEPLVQSYAVGPPRRKPWLRWLHDGTAPHLISATVKYGTRRGARNVAYAAREGGKFLADVVRDRFFGKTVKHPGQPPRPWLFAAWWQSQGAVLRAMAGEIRKALPRQAKRLVSSKFRNQQLRKWLR